MFGWCIAVGPTAAILALTYARHRRRRAERLRLDRVRATVEVWLSALKQPDDSPTPPTTGVVRCSRRVMFGDLNPNITSAQLKEAS